jgi:hypothetical protein
LPRNAGIRYLARLPVLAFNTLRPPGNVPPTISFFVCGMREIVVDTPSRARCHTTRREPRSNRQAPRLPTAITSPL